MAERDLVTERIQKQRTARQMRVNFLLGAYKKELNLIEKFLNRHFLLFITFSMCTKIWD